MSARAPTARTVSTPTACHNHATSARTMCRSVPIARPSFIQTVPTCDARLCQVSPCQRTNARTPTTSIVPPSLTCATMCALSAGVLIPTHTGKISSRHSPLPSPSHTPPLLFAVAQAPMSRQRCSASSITRPSSLCTASPPCWSPSPNKPSAARGLK
jgi:hypothetical protein